jgi:hypothetical protein
MYDEDKKFNNGMRTLTLCAISVGAFAVSLLYIALILELRP